MKKLLFLGIYSLLGSCLILGANEEAIKKINSYSEHMKAAELIKFEKEDLAGADLKKVNLSLATLNETNLTGTHLEGATLLLTNLKGAILIDAHFEGATLYMTDLSGADLTRAHFEGAILKKTILVGADLTDVNFEDTDLRDAIFTDLKSWEGMQVSKSTKTNPTMDTDDNKFLETLENFTDYDKTIYLQ